MKSVTATPNSANRKLGPGWGVTYRPVGPSCPASCPLLENGCYARRHLVGIQSKRSARRRTPASVEVLKLDGCSRVRWDVSGDNLQSDGSLDRDYVAAKLAWHARNQGAISLGYTHAPDVFTQAGYGPNSNQWPAGFNLLASCHTDADAKRLCADGWRTARVVPDDQTPIAKCERLCPVDLQKHRGKPVTTDCAKCRLCWGSEHQEKSIVFIQF